MEAAIKKAMREFRWFQKNTEQVNDAVLAMSRALEESGVSE